MRALQLAWIVPALLPTLAAQTFDAATFERDLAAIVPRPDELAWRTIAWRTELRTALVEASRADKPVLLWAMNGHPLGQT
ncbi:MAG: hypothetical protein WAT39_26055 [Planctomycetota bacterium]